MELTFECDKRWDDLDGTSNTRRHCGQCDKHVYNFSGMTRDQAQRFMRRHEGSTVCVHFVRRDGQIVHEGDPLEQLQKQRSGARKLVAVALLAHGAFLLLADDPAEAFFDPFAAVSKILHQDEPPQKTMSTGGELMGSLVF